MGFPGALSRPRGEQTGRLRKRSPASRRRRGPGAQQAPRFSAGPGGIYERGELICGISERETTPAPVLAVCLLPHVRNKAQKSAFLNILGSAHAPGTPRGCAKKFAGDFRGNSGKLAACSPITVSSPPPGIFHLVLPEAPVWGLVPHFTDEEIVAPRDAVNGRLGCPPGGLAASPRPWLCTLGFPGSWGPSARPSQEDSAGARAPHPLGEETETDLSSCQVSPRDHTSLAHRSQKEPKLISVGACGVSFPAAEVSGKRGPEQLTQGLGHPDAHR